jgi:TolB protein
MRYKILILVVATFVISSSTLLARIIIPPISGPIIRKISIFVPELINPATGSRDEKAREFIEVLRDDLINAALFDVHDDRGISVDSGDDINFQAFFEAGSEALVRGEYQSSGDTITIALRLFDVVQERELLARSYESPSGTVRGAAHRFASAVMKELTGIDGFFNSKIVFVSGTEQNRDLFIMDYDGRNVRRLTNHHSLVLSPNCSLDGAKIVFNSDKALDHDIYMLSVPPRMQERRLRGTIRPAQTAAWSPDRRQIAYSGGEGDIFVANADESEAVNLTHHPAINVSPTWSPDGKQIAFVSDRSGEPQIYVMNSSGSNLKRISSGGYSTDPSWSPNTEVNKIAFVRVEGLEANIFTINPDGSDEQRLTSGSGRNENPSWSPDGHYIAFSSTRRRAQNIYIMYFNGESQHPLTKDGGKSFPTWCR